MSARIHVEQDAGADDDPETDTPATSGYPCTGGVTASELHAFDDQGITLPAETNDVALVVLDEAYELVTYGSLAAPGTLGAYGTGPTAQVTVSGYGLSHVNGTRQPRSPPAADSWRTRGSSGPTGSPTTSTSSCRPRPAAAGPASATPASPRCSTAPTSSSP